MEVRNLITFLKIIETGSFSKAAEQLTYSQSTVTVQIQQLEEEIGVQLFDRIGKKIYVTEKGHELEAYAQQIIALTQRRLPSAARSRSCRERCALPVSIPPLPLSSPISCGNITARTPR